MTVQATEMAKAVRVAIDMNKDDEPLFVEGDTDTLTLDEIIMAKLADAVRLVEMEAPATMLESGHDFGDNIFIGEDGKGFVILPEDFMRLISFRMSDWKRTVFEAISENDSQYALQSSKWKGICGNPEKPVCAIVRRSEGKVLEFYSCNDNTAIVTQATYVPIPRIDIDGGIDVAENCYRAAIYRAASLALASVGDQLSTTMLEISRSLLQ
ncbi:hypothetical protein [uncultured Duncaniella sp.]|uniref:hypothetical protein n=1 Tax=uncultured Duncaniella sp. TaxID=2768039 RepID=UPI00272FDA19|nr:hypothetical protein [uncultured Duncaniella sp.]